MKPLLGLVMLVKDRASTIVDTLQSVKGAIDYWVIVDLGSSDNTVDLIVESMRGVDGELHEWTLEDYATTRNAALERLGEVTDFFFMLNDDEHVVAPEYLRRFCERERESPHSACGAYDVKVLSGPESFSSTRLARTREAWRFVGKAHECLASREGELPQLCVDHAFVMAPDRRQDRARLLEDKRLLELALDENPNDNRALFYLAQTEEDLGDYSTAKRLYQARAGRGGWSEEIYESVFRLARVQQHLGLAWPLSQQAYLDAYSLSPHRAEPLVAIALFWHRRRRWPLAYLYASAAAEIPYPSRDRMVVNRDVYEWMAAELASVAATELGKLVEAKAFALKAVAARPQDKRIVDHAKKLGVHLP